MRLWHWELPRYISMRHKDETMALGTTRAPCWAPDTRERLWHWELPRYISMKHKDETMALGTTRAPCWAPDTRVRLWHWELPRYISMRLWHWEPPGRHAERQTQGVRLWHWELPRYISMRHKDETMALGITRAPCWAPDTRGKTMTLGTSTVY